MHHLALLLAIVALGACVPPAPTPTTTPTLAIIARPITVSGEASYIACEVRLGWTLSDLVSWCGEPDRMLRRAKSADGFCYYYRTQARTFVGGFGAAGVVICTTPRPHGREAQTKEIVDLVVGVDGEP